jgi:hypothetical protein
VIRSQSYDRCLNYVLHISNNFLGCTYINSKLEWFSYFYSAGDRTDFFTFSCFLCTCEQGCQIFLGATN